MKYEDPKPVSHEEAEQIFQQGNTADISTTLVSLALHDPDAKWVEAHCLRYLEDPEPGLRAVAATCLGHLARIHKQLDLAVVIPALQRHLQDPGKWVAGNVENALEDIQVFMSVPDSLETNADSPDISS